MVLNRRIWDQVLFCVEIVNKKIKMVNYNNTIKFWGRVFTRMIDEGFC